MDWILAGPDVMHYEIFDCSVDKSTHLAFLTLGLIFSLVVINLLNDRNDFRLTSGTSATLPRYLRQ